MWSASSSVAKLWYLQYKSRLLLITNHQKTATWRVEHAAYYLCEASAQLVSTTIHCCACCLESSCPCCAAAVVTIGKLTGKPLAPS